MCLGGRTWLSIISIFLAYYTLARKIVTIIIFPGCSYLYQRKLEVSFQESMGKMILDQIKEFSLCLDIFKSGGVEAGMDEYSRSQFLLESARQMRFMITAYAKQMEAQRNYHKKILQA